MFALSALIYPAVLALLCLGGGLLVDRACAAGLPGVLLPALGMALAIAVCEITTDISGAAPATPWVLAVVGAAGLVAGRRRIAFVVRSVRAHRWQLLVPAAAFLIALAPVLSAGRPTFAAYMVLTDSALHMMGADYLIRHGQSYAHLDLLNSYGQYLHSYYATSYPTGADSLLGGSASLLGVPVIWAFQSFNAVMLTLAAGPAWLLARRLGLTGPWAALAALCATVPALVYAYELIGSIKEITVLPLILAAGALVADHRRWLGRGPRAAIPFALLIAAGVSALGVAFGAWAAVAVLVALGVLVAGGGPPWRSIWPQVAAGLAALVVCAWPTWAQLSGALHVAQAVTGTANRGNLYTPLRTAQVFGVWLVGRYINAPSGAGLVLTDVLIVVTVAACAAGAWFLIRGPRREITAWFALMALLALLLTRVGGPWTDAKTLMLTSPLAILLAWAAVAALLARGWRTASIALAVVLAGGVLVSDVIQYHDTDLAPTARYQELASIDSRFAGRGPALFTDFDEYALYVLRDLDIGGPDFIYPPVRLRGVDAGHGGVVNLEHGRAAALRAYPLIITRRDPLVARPPSAYRLLWQGTYYQVWGRTPRDPAAIARLWTSGKFAVACKRVRAIALVARARGGTLVSASPAEVIAINLARAHRPPGWKHVAIWYVMPGAGTLRASIRIPRAGVWHVWLAGQIMPTVTVGVDGRRIGSVGGTVGGDTVIPSISAPLAVALTAGRHTLTVARGGPTLAPGDGGSSYVESIFLTPAGAGEQQRVRVTAPARWRSLCGGRYLWIEAVPPAPPAHPA